MFEAIQRRIERALLDQEALLRDLLDAEQDAIAVQRSQRNGLEDEKVERALQQLCRVTHAALLDWSGEHASLLLGRQGESPRRRSGTPKRTVTCGHSRSARQPRTMWISPGGGSSFRRSKIGRAHV